MRSPHVEKEECFHALPWAAVLLGALLFTRDENHLVSVESWWWNLALGHGVFEPWWWNWVASLGAFAVGVVLILGIAPVLGNWAKEGKFSWHMTWTTSSIR